MERPVKFFNPNRFTPDPKKEKVEKPPYNFKAAMGRKKTKTGEADMFKDIWSKRPHVSEISGEPLGDEMCSWMFMHVLSKAQNRYPLFKLFPPNIVLATWEEHDTWDKRPRSEIENDPKWQPLIEAEKILIEEYKRLTPKK